MSAHGRESTRAALRTARARLLTPGFAEPSGLADLAAPWRRVAAATLSLASPPARARLVRARLAPGGILQQWVQLHHIRRRQLATIVRTLRGVFPHVALFVGGAQGILVAGSAPLVASKARLHTLEERPALRATLDGKHFEDLFTELVASGPELDRFVAESAEGDEPQPISTDDNLYLEYATPKGNVLNYDASLNATLALLDRYRMSDAKARHLGE